MYKKEFSNLNKMYDAHLYTGLLGALLRKNHFLMEKSHLYFKNNKNTKILEIGAGTHPHINYVKHEFESYNIIDLDANDELTNIYKEKFHHNNKVNFKRYDGENIPFEDNTFDRCIISHCLEHIYKPHLFLKEMHRVVKKNGLISIALPTDPGLSWRFGRFIIKYFIQNKTYKLSPLEYDYVNALEHVNSIFNLKTIIKRNYNIFSETYYPFNFIKNLDINLFYIVDIIKK